ncbi:Chitooligosaccharide deacetylase OS=Afipia felis OX=1035 GN=xynD_2 PE=3 SV=1 [Afipia felis]
MKTALSACLIAGLVTVCGEAHAAASCPRPDALGTARTIAVDARTTPRVGLKSFPQTLPLNDKEVVLTFDDGPFPATTGKVLAALSAECVQATFFVVGRNAQASPQMLKAMVRQGHSIGNHTWSHPMLNQIGKDKALADIDKGFAAIDAALAPARPSAVRLFRFPFFASTPALLEAMENRGAVVFGADFWASDWLKMTPQQEIELLTARLAHARKGIILLHDSKQQTAAMLPGFLRYLKQNGYKVVHVVPAGDTSSISPASRAD